MLKSRLKMKDRRGQALVEFALILPIFLLLVFGIIDFGRVISSQMIVSNASRSGARYAAVHEITKEGLKAKVVEMNDYDFITINSDDVVVSYDPNAKWTSPGMVKVSVSHDVDFITPIIPLVQLISPFEIEDPITVKAETTMHIE